MRCFVINFLTTIVDLKQSQRNMKSDITMKKVKSFTINIRSVNGSIQNTVCGGRIGIRIFTIIYQKTSIFKEL